MRIIEFENGYKGKLQRTNRYSAATWEWTLLDPQGVTVATGERLVTDKDAEKACNLAYERVTKAPDAN